MSSDQRKVLQVLERTFSCYITEDPAAIGLKEKLNDSEAKLAQARNTMNLGYTDPDTGESLPKVLGLSAVVTALSGLQHAVHTAMCAVHLHRHQSLNSWLLSDSCRPYSTPTSLCHAAVATFFIVMSAGSFKSASSVQLRNLMRVAEQEAARKSAYEGLRSVGPFVAEAFIGIVKDRNKLAKFLGFQDFYDYKVSSAQELSSASYLCSCL